MTTISGTDISEIKKFCKENAWEEWGFDYLSASSLNAWSSNPARWICDKLLGITNKFSPTVSMMRGKSVLHGVAHYLYKRDKIEGVRAALAAYEDGVVSFTNEDEINAEWTLIEPMTSAIIDRVTGYPELICRSVAASAYIDGIHIPFTSWAGFVFQDRVLEIKTTKRLPSEISANDAKMLAINSITRNLPAEIIYATGKKAVYFTLNEWQKGEAIKEIIQDAISLQTMLGTFNDGTEALKLYPINPQNWTWGDGELERVNKELKINVGKIQITQSKKLRTSLSGRDPWAIVPRCGHGDTGADISGED